MKTAFSAFAIILTLLGQSRQNEIIEVNMQFENNILKSLSTHLVSNIPTQIPQMNDHPILETQITDHTQLVVHVIPTPVAQILDHGVSPQIFTIPVIPQNILTQENFNNNAPTQQQQQDNFNGCIIFPATTLAPVQQKSTTTSVIHITNTVIETVKVLVPESAKTSTVEEVKISKNKKETKTETEKIIETTEVISLAVITPTVKINLYDKRETDIDVNEIWKILESDSTPKKKIKTKTRKHLKVQKNKEKWTSPDVKIKKIKKVKIDPDSLDNKRNETKVLEQRLRKLENILIDKQKKHGKKDKIPSRAKLINDKVVKIKEKTAPNKPIAKDKVVVKSKPVCKGPLQVYEQVKADLKKKDKKFHTLPAKKKKGSCLVEQTVIIPASKLSTPTIPPPLISRIAQNIGSTGKIISDKLFFNCITNYAGTATKTVTSMTIVPVPTTHLTVKTETVFSRVTELLTEVLYTPYTVTTTSTNTMYMIKVTTVNGAGCKNCE